MARKIQIDIPLERIEGKLRCDVQVVQHRDGAESVLCRTVLENGRKVKLIAELCLLPEKDSCGNDWHVSCLSMSTHSRDDERWFDAFNMFRFWFGVFTSLIREDMAKEVG